MGHYSLPDGFLHYIEKLIVGQNNAILQQLAYMQNLLFFSRVALICNLCFVLAWLFRYYPGLQSGHIVSTVLILGLFTAILLNIVVNIVILIFLLQRRPVRKHFPGWLIIVNFLFLLSQIILFVK
jgi:hypothetical protein